MQEEKDTMIPEQQTAPGTEKEKKKRKGPGRLGAFLGGILCGGLVAAAAFVLSTGFVNIPFLGSFVLGTNPEESVKTASPSSAGKADLNYGYLNHVDGYVCTFTVEDGVAVMGSKDEDPYFGATTEAPFYDTYGGNLSAVTLESIEGAGLTPDGEDPSLYHYVYANDINATGDYWYDMSFGSLFMEPLYGDMLSLYLDDSQGRAMMWDMTMDLRLEDDGSISFEIVLPTPIDETTTVDLVIDGSISDIGTTVIPGLSDILDDEPEPSDPWGDWYY